MQDQMGASKQNQDTRKKNFKLKNFFCDFFRGKKLNRNRQNENKKEVHEFERALQQVFSRRSFKKKIKIRHQVSGGIVTEKK